MTTKFPKTTPATKATAKAIPKDTIHAADITVDPAVQKFESLPDSARVRVSTGAALMDISLPTLYRLVKNGKLPRPIKIGGTSGFNVGELRAVLAQPQ